MKGQCCGDCGEWTADGNIREWGPPGARLGHCSACIPQAVVDTYIIRRVLEIGHLIRRRMADYEGRDCPCFVTAASVTAQDRTTIEVEALVNAPKGEERWE